jgi:hypothetical protein
MASSPSEPEKYSIDEMMERLKANAPEEPREEGQLVLRDDGTTAIRVRKRKRRNSQPKKEEAHRNRRAIILQTSAVLALLILTGLAVGGGIVFANSVIFRDSLVSKIEAATGGSVELEVFRMNPTHANANKLSIEWPEGQPLSKLIAWGLKSEISPASFLGRSFVGDETIAHSGQLFLSAPGALAPTEAKGSPAKPANISFTRYGISHLEIIFGDSAEATNRLTGTEASFYPTTVSGWPQMRLSRGEMAIPGWPNLLLDRALFEFRDRDMEVLSMKLAHPQEQRGMLELTGTIRPYQNEMPSNLKITVHSFPLSGLVGGELGSLVAGRVDSVPESQTDLLSFSLGSGSDGNMTVAFRSALDSSIEMKRFPFLFGLSQALRDQWFEQPVFSKEAAGTVRRAAGVVRLADLDLMTKGRMAVRGNIGMDRTGLLSGELDVGLTIAMIESSPTPRLNSLFGPPTDGFRWLKVSVSGSVDSPADNFQEQFEAAGQAPAAVAPAGRSTFEELTRPRTPAASE